MRAMYNCSGGALGRYLRQGGGGGRVHCGDAPMGCHVAISLGDGALGRRTNGLWGRDEFAKQVGCRFGAHQGELGLGRAEITCIGDWAN
jgi:hypothetical protein